MTKNSSFEAFRGPWVRVVVALTVALAVAACGDDASSSSTTGGTTTATGAGGSTGTGTGTGGAASTGSCFDYASYDGTTPATTFKAEVLPVLRRSCGLSTSCHGAESAPAGQPYLGPAQSAGDITAAQIQAIFDQNVGVAATKEPAMKLVAPGDPAKSFLMHKLDGPTCDTLACAAAKACGAQMPQGSALDPAERDLVRRWIAQGAKND